MQHFEKSGIKFMYGGTEINHQVNPKTAELLEKTCAVLASIGVVVVNTLGFRNNRVVRGMPETPENTSAHADGQYPDYEKWPDGSNGCRALDVYGVKFKSGVALHVSRDREMMIAFCESLGWTVLHKKPLKNSDHIHLETPL